MGGTQSNLVNLLPALCALALGVGPLSLLLLPVSAAGFPVYLKIRRDSGKKKFEEQLGQAMPLIASNLRAGSSVAQAIGPVAENMSDPIKSEFRRLASDIRAGTPVPEALDKVADRTGSRDLRLFATAVDISQQTGGSLSEITERVGEAIRAKVKAKRSAEAKTSSARFEAKIVGFAPIVMLLLMSAASEIHRQFFMTPAGWACLGVGIALDIIGFMVLKQISNIRYD